MNAAAKPRVGPAMRALLDVISAQPGLCKAAALRLAGLPSYGRGIYRSLDRLEARGRSQAIEAIQAGAISAS